MSSFLVSFHYAGNQFGITYGSHIVELAEAPTSVQAVMDLQYSLGMEYGVDITVLIAWDILPEPVYPSGNGPYSYFLTFSFVNAQGPGLGSMTYVSSRPIVTLDDLRFTEEWLRSDMQAERAHLVSCKPLKEPTRQELDDYEQLQSKNP